jgi:hypothetical protein
MGYQALASFKSKSRTRNNVSAIQAGLPWSSPKDVSICELKAPAWPALLVANHDSQSDGGSSRQTCDVQVPSSVAKESVWTTLIAKEGNAR